MTKASNLGRAGLVFMNARDIDIVAAANHVVSCFEAMGRRITGVHVLSDVSAQISTDLHDLTIDMSEDVRCVALGETASLFLSFTLTGNGVRRISDFARDALLARALQALNAALKPDFVQWKDANSLLPSQSFAAATEGQTPLNSIKPADIERQIANRKLLPDIEETNAILQDRISNHDPVIFDSQPSADRLREIFSDGWVDPELLAKQEAAEAHAREMEDIEVVAVRRLSAWFMAFAVAMVALPVGVALLIVNLAKGENLRLSSQTAALTGVFVAFQTLGTTANAMEVIQKFIQ